MTAIDLRTEIVRMIENERDTSILEAIRTLLHKLRQADEADEELTDEEIAELEGRFQDMVSAEGQAHQRKGIHPDDPRGGQGQGMKYTLDLDPRAVKEAAEIYAYRERERKGSGERFILALMDSYAQIKAHPYGYQKRKGGVPARDVA
jgi:hypothetical protein